MVFFRKQMINKYSKQSLRDVFQKVVIFRFHDYTVKSLLSK